MLRNALEPWHLLIVVLVIIVVFGSKKLPDSARALGKSLRILKSETRAMKEEDAPSPASSGTAAAPGASAPSGSGGPEGPASLTIRSAPGDSDSARPVAEKGTETR
ncbi:Sec-independent protein translocase subunit TatA [Streptomyces sp. NPDC052042]|uniref:Sec-independent protein translocase subunit TatA n=1 Tax=Streptomyces sp. NPDC052042 TaxID=3365683 RepID=UPI0037CD3F4E